MRLKVETEKNNSHPHLKGPFSFSSQNIRLKENNSRSRLDTIILPCKIVLINHIINIFTVLTITIIIFRLNAITSSLVIRSVWFAYSIAMVAFNRLFFISQDRSAYQNQFQGCIIYLCPKLYSFEKCIDHSRLNYQQMWSTGRKIRSINL